MKKIYNATDVIEAERVITVLKESGIPSYYQDSPHNVTAYGFKGFGLYGVDVFVNDADEEKAQSIIETLKD